MKKRFSPELTLQLVLLYRDHECLWNLHSSLYRSPKLKKRALQKLCTDMNIPGFTVKDLKLKLKSLRSTYSIELDKIMKSNDNGYIYKPKVIWFDVLNSYLRDVTMMKKRVRDDDDEFSEPEIPTPIDSECEPIDNQHSDENINDTLSQVKLELEYPLSKDSFELQIDESRCTPEPTDRKSKDEGPGVKNKRKKAVEKDQGEDEYDIFGKHVANQLRKLSAIKNISAQQEIQCTITKFRIEDIAHS